MRDIIWFAHFPKITYARHKKMAANFSHSRRAFALMELDDFIVAGLEPEIAHEIIIWREKNPWEKLNKIMEDADITALTPDDPAYPALLKQINDPPFTLFIRGQLTVNEKKPGISVVGTRHHSLYGKEICITLSAGLAHDGITIVSGLALGIDSFAHQSALQESATTVAVLGSGVDTLAIYPRSHENLATKIIQNGGAIISEYPPGTAPTAYSFPARNRIIAGLTQGTLVVEAPLQSGALITAQRALDYNREVMAVPHPATSPHGAGGNKLIQRGAALITSVEDIYETLSWQHLKQIECADTNDNDEKTNDPILQYFSHEPQQIEKIIQVSQLPSEKILTALTMLEMQGIVKNLGGGYYIKRSS